MRNDADFQILEFPVLAGFAAVVVTSFAGDQLRCLWARSGLCVFVEVPGTVMQSPATPLPLQPAGCAGQDLKSTVHCAAFAVEQPTSHVGMQLVAS